MERHRPTDGEEVMKCMSRQMRKQQERNAQAEAVAIIMTCFCYVLYKRYHYKISTLQSIVNEVGAMIVNADKDIDWALGLKFWRERVGLKM